MHTIRYRQFYRDAGVRTSHAPVLHQAPSRHRIAYTSTPSMAGVLEASKLAFDPVPPRYLAEGAVLEEGHLIAGNTEGALHLAFTDGLNAISLFERPVTGPSAPGQEIRVGTGQEKVIAWTLGTLADTLIGDLPVEELRKIAQSVKER